MEQRVYGVLGISSIMANWNADFSGYPKTTSDGSVFGSDKALKYPMKKMWNDEGEKVMYIKSMKLSNGKKGEVFLIPRSLKERYEHVFQVADLKNCKDNKEVLANLFQAVDVKNFGAVFAEVGANLAITGAVQIGQGFNKYAGSMAEEQQILSPFRDASDKGNAGNKDKEEAKNSTLGMKIVSNEAHYMYPFAINPKAYQEFVDLGMTEGYTEKDYAKFKKVALCAATSFATNAKAGCENELAVFVETAPDLYLPNLSEYVTFEKGEGKNRINLTFGALLTAVSDRITSIEVYYNPYTTELAADLPGAKYYNITTNQEV